MEELSDAEVIETSKSVPEDFGVLFDRHASELHRYLARRVGHHEAAEILAEVFCAAFEARERYDTRFASALPWLYGIASNRVSRMRRQQTRQQKATARLADSVPADVGHDDLVVEAVDAAGRLVGLAPILNELPSLEREALLLYAWEELSYEEIARAVEAPIGTVRSRLNRARQRLRSHAEELDAVRRVRPDPTGAELTPSASVLVREKERLMKAIDWAREGSEEIVVMPKVFARLAYRDEQAALDYLTRVFGFEEVRAARTDLEGHVLAFLRMGDGAFMIGREDADTHQILSPAGTGHSSVMMQVAVTPIEDHYARAVGEGANITMELNDAFWGERRYEASDLEGHRWHFGESFRDIRARGGTAPEPLEPDS